MKIILTRSIAAPSVPELGQPVSGSFDSMTVPLARPSTGFTPLLKYEIERAPSASGPWAVQASGPLIFGNPPTAYVAGGLIATTTYYWRARAFDTTLRVSEYSAIVFGTTAAQAASPMKMNFGHGFWYLPPNYINTAVPPHRFDDPTYRTTYKNFWTAHPEPVFKVLQLVGYWKSFEGDTRGSYKFAEFRDLLDHAHAQGRKVVVTFQTVTFGNRGPDITQYPQYVLTEHGILNLVNHTLINQDPNNLNNPGYNQGSTAKSWEAATCNDINRVARAWGQEFCIDNPHPAYEGMTFGETGLQINNNHPAHTASYSPTFSNTAIYNELVRAIPLIREKHPTSILRLGVNDFPENLMVPLFQLMKQYWWTHGGPDIYPRDITQGDRVYRGLNNLGQLVYEDLGDVIPSMLECQYQSFQGLFTMDELWNAAMHGYQPTQPNGNGNFFMPSMKPRYVIWSVNETGHVDWTTHQKPYIAAHPQIYEGNTLTAPKPTAYP